VGKGKGKEKRREGESTQFSSEWKRTTSRPFFPLFKTFTPNCPTFETYFCSEKKREKGRKKGKKRRITAAIKAESRRVHRHPRLVTLYHAGDNGGPLGREEERKEKGGNKTRGTETLPPRVRPSKCITPLSHASLHHPHRSCRYKDRRPTVFKTGRRGKREGGGERKRKGRSPAASK